MVTNSEVEFGGSMTKYIPRHTCVIFSSRRHHCLLVPGMKRTHIHTRKWRAFCGGVYSGTEKFIRRVERPVCNDSAVAGRKFSRVLPVYVVRYACARTILRGGRGDRRRGYTHRKPIRLLYKETLKNLGGGAAFCGR